MLRRTFTQTKYFDSDDPDNPHGKDYGPCDGFGPDGTCSECTGMYGHPDGSVSTFDGRIIRKAPFATRLRQAWIALRQASRELNGSPLR